MSEKPNKWIGRIATLIWWHPRWGEVQPPRRVRITDTHQTDPNMDSHNPDGYWYFGEYERKGEP